MNRHNNQNTGRGTRWTERKKYLTVLLPYYTEFAMTQQEMRDALMASKYGPLMEVMAAISSIDDAMSEYRIVPPDDVDDIASSSCSDESVDAVQPSIPVVKDPPVAPDDSESSEIDAEQADAPLVKSLTVVKRLPVEVSMWYMVRSDNKYKYRSTVVVEGKSLPVVNKLQIDISNDVIFDESGVNVTAIVARDVNTATWR